MGDIVHIQWCSAPAPTKLKHSLAQDFPSTKDICVLTCVVMVTMWRVWKLCGSCDIIVVWFVVCGVFCRHLSPLSLGAVGRGGASSQQAASTIPPVPDSCHSARLLNHLQTGTCASWLTHKPSATGYVHWTCLVSHTLLQFSSCERFSSRTVYSMY